MNGSFSSSSEQLRSFTDIPRPVAIVVLRLLVFKPGNPAVFEARPLIEASSGIGVSETRETGEVRNVLLGTIGRDDSYPVLGRSVL